MKENFRVRKFREIKLMRESVNRMKGINSDRPKLTWPDYSLSKLKLRDEKKSGIHGFLGETQLFNHDPITKINGFNFDYQYQRLDLKNLDSPRMIYGGLKTESGILQFTNSAQASLSVILDVLTQEVQDTRLHCVTPLYWETSEFLVNKKWKYSQSGKVAIVDSSCLIRNQTWYRQITKKCKYLIIDTTCWSLWDKNLAFVDKIIQTSHCDVFLVRSHLKLDSLASEWGRLSSIAYFESKNPKRFKNLWPMILNYGRFFCIWANPGMVYPFFKHKSYKPLTRAWIAGIRKSQDKILTQLRTRENQNSKIKLTEFDHGIYFWVSYRSESKNFNDYIFQSLIYSLKFYKLPFGVLASYPWDVIAITRFNQRGNIFSFPIKDNTVLRISIPDLPQKKLEITQDAFNLWMDLCRRTRN